MIKDIWGWPSLILGLLVGSTGLLMLVSTLGVLPFALPGFFGSLYGALGLYILAGLGFFIVIEDVTGVFGGMGEWYNTWLPLVIGFVLLALGVVQVLNNFGVIGFSIPTLPGVVYQALFVLEGIALLLSSWE